MNVEKSYSEKSTSKIYTTLATDWNAILVYIMMSIKHKAW